MGPLRSFALRSSSTFLIEDLIKCLETASKAPWYPAPTLHLAVWKIPAFSCESGNAVVVWRSKVRMAKNTEAEMKRIVGWKCLFFVKWLKLIVQAAWGWRMYMRPARLIFPVVVEGSFYIIYTAKTPSFQALVPHELSGTRRLKPHPMITYFVYPKPEKTRSISFGRF